jgi:putative toxin-antitoxin system antitoxin component (TIGR02293 family)
MERRNALILPIWTPTSAQLVEEGGVLPDYDAKAVAEVMGLAFVRGPKEGRGLKGAPASIFITVDGDTLFIVGRSSHAKGRRVSSPSPILIEKAVESGLPRESLQHVAEAIAGGDRVKASALERGIVPKTTLERRENTLSRQESERTERVARIFVHARRALGSEAEARAFMTTPHPELDGRSPLDAAKTDLGARRAEQILNALEFGLAL